jgi:predicted regulator of Ras-like GTPase activity (Roadblock/LC7/MglB family)
MAGSLAETLHELQAGQGLSLAAVVGSDGLLIESAAEPGVDAESIAAMAASGLMVMDALSRELGESAAQSTTMEFENRIVLLAPVDGENLLVLLAGSGSNLGRLRIALRRSIDQVREALASI